MAAQQIKISAVLNTYNAERLLEDTLRSLSGFDEIVVCDMESTDSTLDIARRYGCKIVIFPKGSHTICEPARNTAIQSASNEWVLVVDADEVVPPALPQYLYNWAANTDCAALQIPFKNHFLNRFDSASYPDYHCRFMRKSKTDWPPVIHAKPQIDGTTDYIPKNRSDLALLHASERTVSYYLKMCRYTDTEVQRRKGRKVTLWNLISEPFFRFFKSYILKGGIFKGKFGYIKAQNDCFYRFMTLVKLYELNINNKD